MLKQLIKRGRYVKKPKPNITHGVGWAWAIPTNHGNMHLCNWAEATEEVLLRKSAKPCSEAKTVRVAIVPQEELRRLKRAAVSEGEV